MLLNPMSEGRLLVPSYFVSFLQQRHRRKGRDCVEARREFLLQDLYDLPYSKDVKTVLFETVNKQSISNKALQAVEHLLAPSRKHVTCIMHVARRSRNMDVMTYHET